MQGGVREDLTAGVPLPTASAAFAGIIELVGGALLILGAATAVVGVLMALEMLGAIVTLASTTRCSPSVAAGP
ncbi:MAG TPA: DoxX family protein [Pseudonocardiaceae bacterium]|nr:DoxX family protein [Pseudonocardiaceae bacterium]